MSPEFEVKVFVNVFSEKFTKDFEKSDFLKSQNLSFFKAISEHLVPRFHKKYFFSENIFFEKIFMTQNIFLGIMVPIILKWL